jgi:glutathione synthase/RimK-type ligase-like ATP-grasp enzyme
MNVLIIGATKALATEHDREYYQKYVDFFVESAESENLDANIFTTLLEDLIISVGDGSLTIFDTFNDKDVADYDVIFFRGDAFRNNMDAISTIQEFATEHSIPTVNEYKTIRDSSKLYQATRFHALGAPVARTLAVNKAVLQNFETHIKDWSFPCILKARVGAHGNDNYLVHSLDEVVEITTQEPAKQFVMQRFVPNNGDFRILIVGDQTMVIKREAVADSHLNNTSKGGTASETDESELPAEVLQHAHALADAFGMHIAGVDAIQDKVTGDYFFLEINAQPQLMSGAFIEKKIAMVGKLLKGLK